MRLMRLDFTPILAAALFAALPARAVVVFDNGQQNDFAGVDPIGAFVRDSPDGASTTVNLLSGTDLGPTDVEDTSLLRVFDGATVDDVDAFDQSRVEIQGGELGGVDLEQDATGSVDGGSFIGCLPCLRLFSQSQATVTGGVFSNPGQIVVSASGSSRLSLHGGTFDGTVRSNDDATLDVFGGSHARFIAGDQSLFTVYGDDFVASQGTTIVLDGFGDLPGNFNGTITGTLADGSPLAVTALNGVSGSRIVLAAAPTPTVPGLTGLIGRSALLLAMLGTAALARGRERGSDPSL